MSDMFGRCSKVIQYTFEKLKDEGYELQDGDEVCTVFNDGVLIVSMEDGTIVTKFILEKPFYMDYSVQED